MEQNFFFQLLKNVILNAFQTETFYLKPPYENVTRIPVDMFNSIFPNNLYADERIMPSHEFPHRRLFITKNTLAFYTIHFYMSLDSYPDIIFIGPFRSDSISLDDYSKDLENSSISPLEHSYLLSYYESLPCISLMNIVNTVTYLINTYMFLPNPVSPIYVDFTTINNGLFDIETASDTFLIQKQVEKVQKCLISLLNEIQNGNAENAQKEMTFFISESKFLSSKDFSKCKGKLYALNTAMQTSIFYTHIQQLEGVKLYFSFIDKISHAHSLNALVQLAYDMCCTYCSLFQNNTFPEYSKIISDVINYIYIHLSEPLSLSVIAEYFNRNASRLSADFKQETGKTLTNFIQQTRINRAINYLNNTTLSVSDVALATGFDDFAYFSRIFKKLTGHSPKEYREVYKNEALAIQ